MEHNSISKHRLSLSLGNLLLLRVALFRALLEADGIDVALAVSFWGCVLLAWPLFLAEFWSYIQRSATEYITIRIAITAFLLVIAGILYLLKKHRRTFYGFAEVVIGFVACLTVLSNPQSNGFVAGVTIAGAVYVMVRGVENFIEGRKLTKQKQMETKADSKKPATVGDALNWIATRPAIARPRFGRAAVSLGTPASTRYAGYNNPDQNIEHKVVIIGNHLDLSDTPNFAAITALNLTQPNIVPTLSTGEVSFTHTDKGKTSPDSGVSENQTPPDESENKGFYFQHPFPG